MQLLRLELKGFKSFADKTVVKFSPGMTAVIGPNCGRYEMGFRGIQGA